MKPLIRASRLTDPPHYYVLTRYRLDGDAVVASTKYDVTDQIEALIDAARSQPDTDPAGLDRPTLREALSAHMRDFREQPESFDSEARVAENIADHYARLSVADGPGPEERPEYSPAGLRYPTLDELNGGPRRDDLPMLRPDAAMSRPLPENRDAD